MSEHIRFHNVPIVGVDAMTADTSRAYPRHFHDQYGMGVLDRGGHASSSGHGQVEAGPGQLIFVNPGEVHDGRGIGGCSRSWRMLYFDPGPIEAFRADIGEGSAQPLMFAAAVFADGQLRRRFDQVFERIVQRPDDTMEVETAMLLLLADVDGNAARPLARKAVRPAPVRRALDRIDGDFAFPLTLTCLATEAGVSRYQLIRGFAREIGLTPHAYLMQRRLAAARRLLRSGLAPAEVALQAGFFDQSHLHRCFFRQFGVTPGRYAARAR